jgi:class 3 adenylate cyclase
MTAATACRTCGTELREGAQFCAGCGAPVADQGTSAENKQVTVLFADVVHSMDIAAAVGAGDCARSWQNSPTGARQWCSVRRHGGQVHR